MLISIRKSSRISFPCAISLFPHFNQQGFIRHVLAVLVVSWFSFLFRGMFVFSFCSTKCVRDSFLTGPTAAMLTF